MLAAVVAPSITVPAARPDTWSERTKLTFGEPVEIPGGGLPPRTYWVRRAGEVGKGRVCWKTRDAANG
jgi:hypothetical protein